MNRTITSGNWKICPIWASFVPPSALEGDNPTSALLHSCTTVVAGIFLVIWFSPLLQNNHLIQMSSWCLGAIRTLFTAVCLCHHTNDMKKTVAFPISSQLGLMMVAIGINQVYVAFFHVCAHAFFKAILLTCSGSTIRNLNDEQDIPKIGGLFKTLPVTSSSLITGSLALTGIPFLTGFNSKHLITEAATTSYTSTWAPLLTIIAASLTAICSTHSLLFVLQEIHNLLFYHSSMRIYLC